MNFKLVPILDQMVALYQLPRTKERFEAYLFMLQGENKKDMILPIAGYNPMAKENVLGKINLLQELQAEQLIEAELDKINQEFSETSDREFKVVINVADNVGGAWSNIHTTDYSSKFEIDALIKRDFCTPYFWTSESYTRELVIQRAREYVYRTLYHLQHGSPTTLADHLQQEIYVQSQCRQQNLESSEKGFTQLEIFYLENKSSTDYNLIFNFFYGDEASESLGYATFGMKEHVGFDYAKYLAQG